MKTLAFLLALSGVVRAQTPDLPAKTPVDPLVAAQLNAAAFQRKGGERVGVILSGTDVRWGSDAAKPDGEYVSPAYHPSDSSGEAYLGGHVRVDKTAAGNLDPRLVILPELPGLTVGSLTHPDQPLGGPQQAALGRFEDQNRAAPTMKAPKAVAAITFKLDF
jgi:hypothetical protein